MTSSNPTWAVVATVDEHPAVIQTFVAWHLWLGASAVYLYFDRPDDPAADIVAGLGRVDVVRCDAPYWTALCKNRPVRHQIRQVRNANHAFAKTEADWLLHIDADEFLWSDQSVSSQLAALYPWTDGAIVPVAERIHRAVGAPKGFYTGPFRRPEPRPMGAPGLTLRGLTGHAIGKAFSRAGADLSVSVHRPQRGHPPLKMETLRGVTVLHFDGLTRLQWVYKLLRKAHAFANQDGMPPSPHRQMQIDAVLENPAAAYGLYDQLKTLTPQDCADLAAAGLLLDMDFDPAEAVMAAFGNAEVPESDQYDAWLMAQKADAPTLLKLVY